MDWKKARKIFIFAGVRFLVLEGKLENSGIFKIFSNLNVLTLFLHILKYSLKLF